MADAVDPETLEGTQNEAGVAELDKKPEASSEDDSLFGGGSSDDDDKGGDSKRTEEREKREETKGQRAEEAAAPPPPSSSSSSGIPRKKEASVASSKATTSANPSTTPSASSFHERFRLSAEIKIPSSVTPRHLEGKVLEMLQTLPPFLATEALQEFDDAVGQKHDIRNPTGYLFGVLKRYIQVHERSLGQEGPQVLPMGDHVTPLIEQKLQALVDTGFCTQDEMQTKIRTKIRMLSESQAVFALDELASVDRSSIRNFASFFMGILNRYMRGDHSSKIRNKPQRQRSPERHYRDGRTSGPPARDRSRDRHETARSTAQPGYYGPSSGASGSLSSHTVPPAPYQEYQQQPPSYGQPPPQPACGGPPSQQHPPAYPPPAYGQQNHHPPVYGQLGQQPSAYGQPPPQQPPATYPPTQSNYGQPPPQQHQRPPAYPYNSQLVSQPTPYPPSSYGHQAPSQQQPAPSYPPPVPQLPATYAPPSATLDIQALADQAASAIQSLNKGVGAPPPAYAAPPAYNSYPPTAPSAAYNYPVQPSQPSFAPPTASHYPPQSSHHAGNKARTEASIKQLPYSVQMAVRNLEATGQVSGTLDGGILGMIHDLPEATALAAIQRFAEIDKTSMRSKNGYLAGVLRKELQAIGRR